MKPARSAIGWHNCDWPVRDRLEAHSAFYAKLVTANAGVPQSDRLVAAFAAVPRERFVGPGPWRVFTPGG